MNYKALTKDSIKDVDTAKGIVKFAFAHFDSVDSDGDIIKKGAYAKTIKESGPEGKDRIYHYKNHNNNVVVGKAIEVYETSEYGIMVSKLSMNTAGRDTLIEYQEGIIKEHSQGFFTVQQQKDMEGNNIISEVRMVEASTLTKTAANGNTPVFELKSYRNDDLIKELQKRVSIGSFSDEYLKQVEELISLHKQSQEPPKGTLHDALLESYSKIFTSLTIN